MLVTNGIAFVSFEMFWYGHKGEPVSVTGSLVYVVNFINMLVLFVVCQIRVFES